MIYRHAILYGRHLDRKFELFLWPSLDALMFGAIGTYAARKGGNSSVALMLAGFLMAQIVWQAHIHFTKVFMQEMWDFHVLYMMTRPISGGEVMAAAMILSIVMATTASVFIAIASAVTFHLNLMYVSPWFAVIIPLLMIQGWTTGIFVSALLVRLGQKADNFAWAMYGLIGPLSGSIVPISNLPGALREIAILFPTTHAYEAGRALLFGGEISALSLLYMVLGTLGLFATACYALNRSVSTFRCKGNVARYL